MNMYLIGLLMGLAVGLTVSGRDTNSKLAIRFGDYHLPLGRLIGAIAALEIFMLINDLTYAGYIGSFLQSVPFFVAMLIAGLVIATIVGDVEREGPKRAPAAVALVMLSGFIMLVFPSFLGYTGSIVALLVVLGLFGYMKTRMKHAEDGTVGPNEFALRARAYLAVFLVGLLLIATVNIAYHPSDIENDLYRSLVENNDPSEREDFINNTDEVRVISWTLATAYLQRAYGDAAAVLSTDQYVLDTNTDPTYVNGKFVWINAPRYEFAKWFGGKTVPFFVYVENSPEKMTVENPNITHKIETPFEAHREKITWEKRLVQIGFENYAMEYEIAQIRFDIDDDLNPYWVLYLAERDMKYNVLNLKKILIVDAKNMDDADEYDIDDPSIPAWLEVVYPDFYVYDWAKIWGKNRYGFGYRLFNKRHLYNPDDITARFLVVDQTTYWQVPMVQQDSAVLGGYILVNTRTGETTFYNREQESYCEKDTAKTQVRSYLKSGQIGFQDLAIHETYLYPIKLDSGHVRECYILPLYAGYTIQKYAIVDAQEYTAPPIIGTNLNDVIDKYQAQAYGPIEETNETALWEEYTIQNGYVGDAEILVTLNNTSYVVTPDTLAGGVSTQSTNEYRELQLALADFQRTGNTTIDVVISRAKIVDVDWLEATFVTISNRTV